MVEHPALLTGIAIVVFLTASPGASEAAPAESTRPCVDVQIGSDRSAYLNCLNDDLQRRVEHERGTPPVEAPIGAQSPPNQVGTFTEGAARQRMGNAFGVSAIPQRPARNFVDPSIPLRSH
jgi:hypothetical protein